MVTPPRSGTWQQNMAMTPSYYDDSTARIATPVWAQKQLSKWFSNLARMYIYIYMYIIYMYDYIYIYMYVCVCVCRYMCCMMLYVYKSICQSETRPSLEWCAKHTPFLWARNKFTQRLGTAIDVHLPVKHLWVTVFLASPNCLKNISTMYCGCFRMFSLQCMVLNHWFLFFCITFPFL